MIKPEEIRTLEIKTPEGWVKASLPQVEPNDVFRQYEPDGTLVTHNGKSEFTALSRAIVEVEGV